MFIIAVLRHMRMSQAHKMHDHIHDIELSTVDAKTVGEVKMFAIYNTVILL